MWGDGLGFKVLSSGLNTVKIQAENLQLFNVCRFELGFSGFSGSVG